MERRVTGNPHARCEAGEKLEIISKVYLSLFPRIESAEMMFSASRSRRVSICAIIQSFAQLDKNYGKEGSEIITDNTQLTIFGGFAPNSESAQVLSKAMGSRTVQSGSVSRGKNDPSQSIQMMERALMTPDELKSMPKGQFVVMKTGFYPMIVKLKLFFKWGISFGESYTIPDKGNRKVSYAGKDTLQDEIFIKFHSKVESDKSNKVEIPNDSGNNDTSSNGDDNDGGQRQCESHQPRTSPPIRTGPNGGVNR